MKAIEELLRERKPKAALEADHKRSRSKAIHLNCLACCNGNRNEVVGCGIQTCFLWPFRMDGANTERTPGVIPDVAEYERRVVENAGGEERMAELRERGRKLFDRQIDDPDSIVMPEYPKSLGQAFAEADGEPVTRPIRPVRKVVR